MNLQQAESGSTEKRSKKIKFNNRIKVFDYNCFDVILDRKHKSVVVQFNQKNVDTELIFELETFIKWCKQHVEVNCLYFKGSDGQLFGNLDYKLQYEKQSLGTDYSEEKLKKIFKRWQSIIISLFHLPQTIVTDLGSNATDFEIEFSLAADIRVMHYTGHMRFNHLQVGHTPLCGSIGVLQLLINPSFVKSWLLSNQSISVTQMLNSGFLTKAYDKEDLSDEIFQNVSAQAPVARIQAKKSFLMYLLPELERICPQEFEIAEVSLANNDWKNKLNDESFMSARDFIEKNKATV